MLTLRLRAVSPLLATIILIAIVLSAGLVVYAMLSGWMGIYSSMLSVQPTSVDLVIAGDKALLSVSVKNTGNKPLAGIVVTGYDDNGKPFKLALSPAEPGQASGNTLVIPLGVSNIVLDASGNNNHGTIYGATWVDGIYGKALSFDGVDDYAIVSPFSVYGWSGISICRWVKLPSYKPNTYWSKSFMIGDYWTDYPCFFHGYPNTNTVSGVTMWFVTRKPDGSPAGYNWGVNVLDTWVFVVDTFDLATRLRCGYLNGALKYSATIPSDYKTILEWNPGTARYPGLYKRFVIGASTWLGEFVNEVANEVRIYNRAFDDGEVSFSNANPGLPPTRGLVAWYPMDEGTNAPFSFTAGSSYALTITAYSLDGSVVTQTIVAKAMA